MKSTNGDFRSLFRLARQQPEQVRRAVDVLQQQVAQRGARLLQRHQVSFGAARGDPRQLQRGGRERSARSGPAGKG